MSYRLEWRPSPNFTPNAQVKAFYGRPRTIEFGAGHWWNRPELNPQHDGIVNYMANPARQAAPHAVLSANRVTEMVKAQDAAWCTSNANPYTYAIETDPHIMYKWQAGGDKNRANAIFETLAEYIADKGFHNLTWKAHNQFPVPYTECNPIHWNEVMARAKQIWNAKHAPAPPKPTPPATAQIEWSKLAKPIEMIVTKDGGAELWDFNKTTWSGFKSVKHFSKGERIIIYGKAVNKNLGATYLVTQYSFEKRITNGFNQVDLAPYTPPAPPKPEWIRNLKDIKPVKLMVLPAQTPIVNLNDLSVIKQLGQGTWVDFVKSTTVSGKEYLISSYSATNNMPNGIARADVGEPAAPPVNEKPEWLKNWEDIADVKMYARADCELVNLMTGETIQVIPRGTEVEIASATLWLDRKYMITKYSTDKQLPHGIVLEDLDMKPVADEPAEPAPEQPDIETRLSVLEKIVELIRAALAKIGIKI